MDVLSQVRDEIVTPYGLTRKELFRLSMRKKTPGLSSSEWDKFLKRLRGENVLFGNLAVHDGTTDELVISAIVEYKVWSRCEQLRAGGKSCGERNCAGPYSFFPQLRRAVSRRPLSLPPV